MQTAFPHASRLAGSGEFTRSIPGRCVLGLTATLVVAAAAHVSLPLWFTPVPLTLQPLAVLGVGLALGPVTGFFAMLAYLAEGALALPVFSPSGLGGVAHIFGPTGGFLMAYPAVAAIAGGLTRLLRNSVQPFLAALIGCAIAVALLFTCGSVWLMSLYHLSAHQTWGAAVLPFLPGEAIKVLAAAGVYSATTSPARS